MLPPAREVASRLGLTRTAPRNGTARSTQICAPRGSGSSLRGLPRVPRPLASSSYGWVARQTPPALKSAIDGRPNLDS